MYKELENAFIAVASRITGLDPNKGEIRVAYAEEPAPSWKHTDNVIAFYVNPLDDLYGEDFFESEITNEENITRNTTFTDVVQLAISCYGPKSREFAKKLQVYIQKRDYRKELTSIGAFPVLKTPSPKYVPYEYNKQWWQRTDLELTLNVETTFTDQVNFLESANISVITDKGEQRNVNITDKTSG